VEMPFERVIVAVVIIAFAFERLANTFCTPRVRLLDAALEKRESRFTAVMLMLYSVCVIGSVYLYFNSIVRTYLLAYLSGISLLVGGCLLRRRAISSMGCNWSVSTLANSVTAVVQNGPFKISRHPYYWASFLELVGVSVFLHSVFGVLFSVFVYFPLLVYRSILEEKDLNRKFPLVYEKYKTQVNFFV